VSDAKSETLIDVNWYAEPSSPERAVAMADAFAETVRALNHGTQSSFALVYPSHVYSVLGNLYTGTAGLPQLFQQLAAFIAGLDPQRMRDARAVADVPDALVGVAAALADAGGAAALLTKHLQRAQSAISGLSYEGGSDGEDED
jgi:hypothetical protein